MDFEELKGRGDETGREQEERGRNRRGSSCNLGLARGEWGKTELIWGTAPHPSCRGFPGYEAGGEPINRSSLHWAPSGERASVGGVEFAETRACGASF